MASALVPGERVRRTLLGLEVDRIPFTVYENKVVYGRSERELRNDGMCIVQRRPPFYRIETPNCSVTSTQLTANGRAEVHTRIETPRGILTAVHIDQGDNQPWRLKHLYADPADLEPLCTYVDDFRYVPNYGAVREKERVGGGDFFQRGALGYSPLLDIIYVYMGLERFSFEWADNRSAVIRLYDSLCRKREEILQVSAGAPQLAINICGNVSASVLSPQMFRTWCLPRYNEAAEALHRAGKLVGIHFDGITRPYADAIRESGIDYVEALTPPPTCDVSVREAHELWPDKILWVNFPSSVHMEPVETVRAVARQILEEARPHRRFLLGITEDVPADRWEVNFRAILDEVNGHRI
jgi:hypothetical protein